MGRVAVIIAAVVGFLITALSGYVILPFLRKLHYGQTINEIGPKWHLKKQGTPIMGGFMFIIGSLVGLIVAFPFLNKVTDGALYVEKVSVLLVGIITALAFSAVGFVDDYLKAIRKQNLGLNAKQKMLFQILITVCFLVSLQLMGVLSTYVSLPFIGTVNFGIFYYPIAFILIIGVVNAVNLTDGVDGLASSITFWVMCGYLVLLSFAGRYQLSLWAASLAGSCLGFLLWNFHPAKVFMGDTGSMYLGGVVAVMGFCMGSPEVIPILGLIYILEALSVMIQVTYFKITHGKRLFKMTPIHHHFEMSGWSEVKIVVVFDIFTIVCVLLACLYGYYYL